MTEAEEGLTNGAGGGHRAGLEGIGQGPAGRQQDRFTSLSTLGAQAPLSPTESPDGLRSDWIRQPLEAIKELANLLGPNVSQDYYSASDVEQRDVIVTGTTVVNEQTPLLQNNRMTERRQTTAPNGGRKGKYIGGGCYCDPLGRITTVNANQACQDDCHSTPTTRKPDCQMCNSGGGSACFAYGSVRPSSILSTATLSHHQKGPSGMTLAVLAQVCFAILSLLAATLAKHQTESGQQSRFDALQMLIGQAVLTFIISLTTLLFFSRGKVSAVFGRRGARLWLWIRALCASTTAILFILAAQVLPIADVLSFVYLAPIVYNFTSHLLFTSRHPFRAQLVSLSLWLGLVLMVQPNFLFGSSSQDDSFEDETVAALPLDLPALVNAELLPISVRTGYAAMTGCGLFTLFTMAVFDETIFKNSQRKVSAYQTILISSLITILAGIPVRFAITKDWDVINISALQNGKSILLFFSIVVIGFFGKILQDLSLIKTGACQFGLISFLQPLLSTGIDLVFPDLASDVLSLAGCLLIIVNLAWIASPFDDDDEEEDH